MINKPVEVVYLAFSGNATARGYSNHIEGKVASLGANVKKLKDAEKAASEKERKAE